MPAHYAKAEFAERGAIARFKEKRGEDRHDLQNTQSHGVRGRASEQGGDAPVPEGQAAVGGVQDAKGNQGGVVVLGTPSPMRLSRR